MTPPRPEIMFLDGDNGTPRNAATACSGYWEISFSFEVSPRRVAKVNWVSGPIDLSEACCLLSAGRFSSFLALLIKPKR